MIMASPIHVVIISEDPLFGNLGTRIRNFGFRVGHYPSPTSVVEVLRHPELRLVVMDDAVLGDRPADLVRQFRDLAPRCPLVYVADRHDFATERAARAAGVSFYTSKPVDLDHMTRVMTAFLKMRGTP